MVFIVSLKELKARRDHWRDLADRYVEHSKKKRVKKEPHSTRLIRCPLCQKLHLLDTYSWVDTCQGYMSLVDFELIVKIETGESVSYAS